MNDYDRVAQVIRYLDEHHSEQPDLAQLAATLGLSEAHFHRLFRRWAGVTPKDFLQCLTAEHARTRLKSSVSVLDAAHESGLSGPGRLHDLMVTLEAASPGEVKNGGEGMEIRWGVTDSPFGPMSIGWNSRGICHLIFRDDLDGKSETPELRLQWPNATLTRGEREAAKIVRTIFTNEPGHRTEIRAYVRGSAFQLKVWRALLQIPSGAVSTYGRLAKLIGDAKAARAVGTACGNNPVGYLIPCHRVIRETGVMKGYRWGTTRKRAILAWEGAERSAA